MTTTNRHPVRRRHTIAIDPYYITPGTWTREELLRARGMKVTHNRRPSTTRKAAVGRAA